MLLPLTYLTLSYSCSIDLASGTAVELVELPQGKLSNKDGALTVCGDLEYVSPASEAFRATAQIPSSGIEKVQLYLVLLTD